MIDDLAAWLDTQGYCKLLWLEWNAMAFRFLEAGNWKNEIWIPVSIER
jgi:hypothetical protein